MSNFENEKNTGGCPLCLPEIRREALHKEASADYVLPDYMGDVKRVLKYTAEAVPCNKIISGEEASFLAIVTFRVEYLDGEDMLTEAVFSSEAEFLFKVSENSLDTEAEYSVSSMTVRLGGPRKISARASVLCDASSVEMRKIAECSEYDGAQMRKKDIQVHKTEYLKCAEREYAEEVDRLEEIAADDIEVVKSYAKAFIDAVHKTDSGVNLSGYADVFAILRGDEGLKRVEKRIPIEEHIECELQDGCFFVPNAYVTGVNVNLNNVTSDDECAVSAVMAITVVCGAVKHYNETVCIINDAFYEKCENKCAYKEIEFSRLCECVYDKASLSFNVERSEEPLRDIIERDMTLKNLRYEIEGGEITVACDAELSLITRANEPESCASRKEKAEFKKKYRTAALRNGKVCISAVPCEVSVSFDAEKIYVESEILVSLMTEARECESIISEIEYESKCEQNDRCVTVYYPDKDDTLWSVSKKYAVSPESVSAKNNVSGEDVYSSGKIIIYE